MSVTGHRNVASLEPYLGAVSLKCKKSMSAALSAYGQKQAPATATVTSADMPQAPAFTYPVTAQDTNDMASPPTCMSCTRKTRPKPSATVTTDTVTPTSSATVTQHCTGTATVTVTSPQSCSVTVRPLHLTNTPADHSDPFRYELMQQFVPVPESETFMDDSQHHISQTPLRNHHPQVVPQPHCESTMGDSQPNIVQTPLHNRRRQFVPQPHCESTMGDSQANKQSTPMRNQLPLFVPNPMNEFHPNTGKPPSRLRRSRLSLPKRSGAASQVLPNTDLGPQTDAHVESEAEMSRAYPSTPAASDVSSTTSMKLLQQSSGSLFAGAVLHNCTFNITITK